MLPRDVEAKFLEYIINSPKGIYYIYDGCLREEPGTFCSKVASRYIYAHEILSGYSCVKSKLQYFVEWINSNISEDGLWDMGASVKDKMYLPLSNSWRKPINRKIDCTVRILRILDETEGHCLCPVL
ncbi:hypothetical protein [Clostridium thermarum]|uniref:hypothetical protein n=1 Tax=Clostridium thermarum TaxID=1716543 RepID=UPI00111F4EE3|nr:hypothetical protein [Clostridium thermarum]